MRQENESWFGKTISMEIHLIFQNGESKSMHLEAGTVSCDLHRSKENVRVAGGNLILEVERDNANIMGTTREYSSGRVRTKESR